MKSIQNPSFFDKGKILLFFNVFVIIHPRSFTHSLRFQMKVLVHSWDDLIIHLMVIAAQIRALQNQPDLIVAIARGGLVPARILSDLLGPKVASFTVSSYDGLQRKDDEHMSFELGGRLDHHRHVLLVDDVSDSGMTFARAIKYLRKHGAGKITTTAIFTKPGSVLPPDIYAVETDAWIIFPFDILENIRKLREKQREKGISDSKIHQWFIELNIPSAYLFLLLQES